MKQNFKIKNIKRKSMRTQDENIIRQHENKNIYITIKHITIIK